MFLGTVLFLEEDHFVSEDFLYVLNLMHQQALAMPENKVTSASASASAYYILAGGYLMFGHLPQKVQS